jgi:hypothetical protein
MSAKSTWLIAVALVALLPLAPGGKAARAQIEPGNSFLITHVRPTVPYAIPSAHGISLHREPRWLANPV